MKELVYQPNRTLSCSASCPVCPPITQEAFRKFHSLIPLLEQTARTPSPSDPASSDRFSRPANPPRDLSLSSRSQSHSRVTFIKSHPLFVHPTPPSPPPRAPDGIVDEHRRASASDGWPFRTLLDRGALLGSLHLRRTNQAGSRCLRFVRTL
jgi:hypothetical protein